MTRAFATAFLALAAILKLNAIFVMGDVENVPVDRVIRNLTARAAAQPADPKLLATLARVNAMAYALKLDQLGVEKRTGEPVAGFMQPNAPAERVVGAGDAAKQRIAEQHLAAALKYYRTAMELAPDDVLVRLGYAWCLDQAGRTSDAIAEYRRVIGRAWEEEKNLDRVGPGSEPVTAEAIDYLLKLLDPERDAAEAQALRARREHLARLPRMVTPLVIPLRDGLVIDDLTPPAECVRFDADGSGVAREWTWISPDAGWLVWDPAGQGRITSGLQLFGNVTFWLFWSTGYDSLCALDDDGDGQLSGKELAGLAIWRDLNRNGISEPGEVEPLSRVGVSTLSCSYQGVRGSSQLAAFSPRGVTFRDGSTRPSYDVWLHPREHRLTE